MANPFVGEIKLVPYTFAPQGFAFCNGALMAIAQNDTLFNLIGTTYGGDGQNTFALPDLRGRAPVHMGTSNFGTNYVIGELAGTETVTLTVNQLPVHTHDPIQAGVGGNDTGTPVGARVASGGPNVYTATNVGGGTMPLASAGGSQPHDNMAPFLVINFVISLFGIFPSQN